MDVLILLVAQLNADVMLNATYSVDSVWATAFQTTVTLTNTTATPVTAWTASFAIPQGYVLSSYVSNGSFSVNGQSVTVHNLSSNATISAGASTTFTVIINMPQSAPTVLNQLQASGTGSGPTPPSPPPSFSAPVLQTISVPSGSNSYTVSWSAVMSAQSYTLQESMMSDFTTFQTLYNGPSTSFQVMNKPAGTYYYRVLATAVSNPSNIQSTTITVKPPVTTGVEHSAWYIDWTSWFNGPPFVIPSGNDMLNIFVGQLMFDASGKPTIGGFGNLTPSQIDAFTAYCHAHTPRIGVKVSIGGAGGMYDRCWDLLTTANVQVFAQGMVDYCHAHGLDGVDFDYEEFASSDQEVLVGSLIKNFKQIAPQLQTSLCTNAGFGPNYPWQAVVKTIFDAAMLGPGNCAVDRLYIMSYYDPMQSEEAWITGWANWVIQSYGFTPARVCVGIDDFDAHAYDPVQFAAWAASQGYSTAHWAFDPARP